MAQRQSWRKAWISFKLKSSSLKYIACDAMIVGALSAGRRHP